jgi:hypothetical protein
MEKQEIIKIVASQRAFFESGATLEPRFRLEYLKKLRPVLVK